MTSLLEAFAFHGVPFDGEAALRVGNVIYTERGIWTKRTNWTFEAWK